MAARGLHALDAAMLWRWLPIALVLAALLFAERRWPWRPARVAHRRANLLLGALSFAAVLLLPLASMALAAQWAATERFGLFHRLALPSWLQVVLTLLMLDLALYAQHRALHGRWFWRLHRVHHTDPMLDVTSGVRFHPFEAGASALYKSLIVVLLGAPVVAVALSTALTLLASLFTHANIRLAPGVERLLRWVLVTPALHRLHHSSVHTETQSNFGSVLMLWDRLFGSACTEGRRGDDIQLGVEGQAAQTELLPMLAEPFESRPLASRTQ